MKGSVIFVLGIILLCSNPAFADMQHEIDSLQQVLATASQTKQKIKISIRLSQLYWYVSPKKSIQYGKQALSLSEKINDNKSATEAYLYLAVAEYYTGSYDSCIYFSKKAMTLSPEKRQIATNSFAFNLMSISYKSLGQFDRALDYAKQSYKIRSKTTDTINIAGSLDNIAHIYRQMGNYDKVMEYSLKALELFQKAGDTIELAKTYASLANLYLDMEKTDSSLSNFMIARKLLVHNKFTAIYADIQFNIATIYLKEQQYDTALYFFKTSMQVYRKMGIKSGEAESYQNMALCYAGKEETAKALQYLYKSFIYFKSTGTKTDIADVERSMGDVFMQSHLYDSAEYYLGQAYELSRKLNYATGIKSSLKSLSLLYEKTGNPKALPLFKQYIAYRDSIDGKEVQMKLEELKTKYETSEKQKEILKLEVLSKTEKARNQALIFILIALALVFSAVVIYYYFKRKNEHIICRQKNLIAHKNEILAKTQLEKSRLLSKRLTEKLNYQTRQLTTHSLNMMQKSKLLQDINTKLDEIIRANANKRNEMLMQLKSELVHSIKSENDWTLFKMYFEQINRSFIDNLKEINPDLTENEVRLCALFKIGMSLKETASIMNISPNSVKNARHRLKNKLGLTAEDDLNAFISNL